MASKRYCCLLYTLEPRHPVSSLWMVWISQSHWRRPSGISSSQCVCTRNKAPLTILCTNWDVEPLCRTTEINDIPNPRVVLAVKTDVGDNPKSVATQLKLVGQMSKEEIVQQQLASFIEGNRGDSELTASEDFGKRLLSALEVKPGWMGVKFDLKKLMEKNKPK